MTWYLVEDYPPFIPLSVIAIFLILAKRLLCTSRWEMKPNMRSYWR